MNRSETLFAEYLDSQGYVWDYEPDLGALKRPDFRVQGPDGPILCEIKSFETFSWDRLSASEAGGAAQISTVLDPVRNRIKRAATQLRPYADHQVPLLVILSNERGLPIPLDPVMVVGAMYGNVSLAVSTTDFDAPPRWDFGRDGQLTTSHPYISGVGVLEERVSFPSFGAQEPYSSPDEAADRLNRALSQRMFERRVALSVFESLSSSAVRIPRNVFRAELDTRWGPHGSRYSKFEQVDSAWVPPHP